MTDPFGALGGLGGMLGGMKAQIDALKAESEKAEVEGTAGSLVVVRMNGAMEVLSVRIDPKAMTDKELLEDLVRAATNDACRKARESVASNLAAIAQRFGLPPGLL